MNMERYTIQKLIQKDGFGAVFRAVRNADSCPVALKQIDVRLTTQFQDGVLREIYCLIELSDVANISTLWDYFYCPTTNSYVLVFELYDKFVDLFDYISERQSLLPENTCKLIFNKIVHIIDKIEKKGFCHGDIKTENVMFNLNTNAVKLLDFGACRRFNIDDEFFSTDGTPAYWPPEWFLFNKFSGRKATVWSLGIFLCDILYGYIPEILDDNFILPHMVASDKAEHLIRMCLKRKPCERLKIEDILRHEWLK